MSAWDGPATRYEITVAGDDDVLDAIAAAVRAWANPRGRQFFMWRTIPPAGGWADETSEPDPSGRPRDWPLTPR